MFTKFYFFNVLNPDDVENGETPQVLPFPNQNSQYCSETIMRENKSDYVVVNDSSVSG